MSAGAYRELADLVLITHVSFVAFVVLGLLAIICGGLFGWAWIRNPWLRAFHLVGIGIVILQSWVGVICPLTTLEMFLREKAGDSTYTGSFVAHWLQKILYFEAPSWVFVVGYTLFGVGVAFTWLRVRPRPFRRQASKVLSRS